MKRVVILGRGASGKSALAACLAEITGLPVIELDKSFWRPGLIATPREEWLRIQKNIAAQEKWIMDGDLGASDALEPRLHAADTILFLDFSLARCAARALRRSRERADFWRLLVTYRRKSRPPTVASHLHSRTRRSFPRLPHSRPSRQIPRSAGRRTAARRQRSRAPLTPLFRVPTMVKKYTTERSHLHRTSWHAHLMPYRRRWFSCSM